MQRRLHRMRKQQRRESARTWIKTGAVVTIKSYAKRYGVDKYTAYDDLTAIGAPLPAGAQHWARRPPGVPRKEQGAPVDEWFDDGWAVIDGRRFFVAGYTSGGAPYGIFEDEIPDEDPPPPEELDGVLAAPWRVDDLFGSGNRVRPVTSTRIVRIAEPEIGEELENQLAALLRLSFPDYPGRSYFKLPPHFRYVALADDTVVAQLGVEYRVVRVGGAVLRTFGVVDLCVRDDQRSQGLAGRLLAEVTAYARACRTDFVLLFADDTRLYERNGWASAGNLVSWLKINEHAMLGLAERVAVPELMVTATGELPWPDGDVDLLGHLF